MNKTIMDWLKRQRWGKLLGCLLMLSLAITMGLLKGAAEMGVLVAAFAICFFFLNLHLFTEFGAAGVSAKLRQSVDEAQATLAQLQSVATAITRAALTSSIGQEFWKGIPHAKRLQNDYALIEALRGLGASDSQIKHATQTWREGMSAIFLRNIFDLIPKNGQGDLNEQAAHKEAIEKFKSMVHSALWIVPSALQSRAFLRMHNLATPEVNEWLDDYEHFEDTMQLRRPDVFFWDAKSGAQ